MPVKGGVSVVHCGGFGGLGGVGGGGGGGGGGATLIKQILDAMGPPSCRTGGPQSVGSVAYYFIQKEKGKSTDACYFRL